MEGHGLTTGKFRSTRRVHRSVAAYSSCRPSE
jgi:hypothetical protein